jgi:hypothetical protein
MLTMESVTFRTLLLSHERLPSLKLTKFDEKTGLRSKSDCNQCFFTLWREKISLALSAKSGMS